MKRTVACLVCCLFAFICLHLQAAPKGGPTWIEPEKARAEDPDFSIQGEYGFEKEGAEWGLQVVAMGKGAFDAYLLEGGLPGTGWTREKKRIKLKGMTEGEKTVLNGGDASVVIVAGKAEAALGGQKFSLPRIVRKSSTLGMKPPKDAIVLFDGTSADEWEKGKIENGLLVNNNPKSKRKFGSYQLHLEFRTPYKPFARGQGRGNSGVYHQSRYETQVLDSFALEGRDNETGGIYKIAAPRVNSCLPPLSWQTYDVEFTQAKWEGDKKVENARITVKLNGVLVHENQALPNRTQASPLKEGPGPGPIYLQHHGNPVRYRNIWIIEKP